MLRPLALALATLPSVATPALAQQASAPPIQWELSRRTDGCSSRYAGETVPAMTLFEKAGEPLRLTIRGVEKGKLVDGPVTLEGKGMARQEFKRNSTATWGADGTVRIDLPPYGDAFFVDSMSIRALDRATGRVLATPQMMMILGYARRDLHRCAVEVSRIDPGSGQPATTDPVLLPETGYSDDYPAAALRAEMEGAVTARVTVSAKGLVSDCVVAGSSGFPLLDVTTCFVFSRRRFTPATDAAGKPTQATIERRLNWVIPK
jgi:TonB family protein